ncbi:MAG TPA: FHA domain-containing protein, partial [Phototrophicaceae bacterium]|nr:FHA domain-containing protein [Phototrophicaceae bacterium]
MAYGRLDVFWPDGLFKTYVLSDATVSIGRSSGNTIALESDTLSRYHDSITYKDGEVRLTDLGSANGTFVDGVRLAANQPHTLYG